jgi:hypothetical protein
LRADACTFADEQPALMVKILGLTYDEKSSSYSAIVSTPSKESSAAPPATLAPGPVPHDEVESVFARPAHNDRPENGTVNNVRDAAERSFSTDAFHEHSLAGVEIRTIRRLFGKL